MSSTNPASAARPAPKTSRCPTCGRSSTSRTAAGAINKAFPFCVERCQLIDLGKWLGEEFRIAGPDDGSGVSAAAGNDDGEA